jgi:hypothetical protein
MAGVGTEIRHSRQRSCRFTVQADGVHGIIRVTRRVIGVDHHDAHDPPSRLLFALPLFAATTAEDDLDA